MKNYKKNVFSFGVLVLIFLISTVPIFSQAVSYNVIWDMEVESDSLSSLSVDVDNNAYYSYWDSEISTYSFAKVTDDGLVLYDKPVIPEPESYMRRIDDNGNYFFISVNEQPYDNTVLGKEFTFTKYTSDLNYVSTSRVNLSNYFTGNFTGNLYYVDSDCTYFAIWEYQDEVHDLDSIQLAKFSVTGVKLWNRTIATTPDSTVFGFCKNSLGNIYVSDEGIIYYLDDDNGQIIWQKLIILDNSQYTIDSYHLTAFQENVLLVSVTLGQNLLLKLWNLDNSTGWELVVERDEIYHSFAISSVVVEGEYLGIVTYESSYVQEDQELTNIFKLKLLNMTKGVLYEEKIEYVYEIENPYDISRKMRLYPTSDGHFYLYECFKDEVNSIDESSIKFCIPRPNFSSGYTLLVTFAGFSALILAVIIRKRMVK